MALIVQKFGGTSVNGDLRIRACVDIVRRELSMGNQVIIVVSAMSGVTDSLISQASSIGYELDSEIDVILSCGEQMTCAMMSMALNSVGIHAKSWLGWQIPILTNDNFTNAEIVDVDVSNILLDLKKGITPIIAGFQGVCNGRITTIGRGGSDTSAAAIASAVDADRCDVYTDVDGVYTGDPRRVLNVKKLSCISYKEMFEMSLYGAKVVHSKAVNIVQNAGIPMHVLSSFNDTPGTVITDFPAIDYTGVTFLPFLVSVLELDSYDDGCANTISNFILASSYEGSILKILIKSDLKNDAVYILSSINKPYKVADNLRVVSLIGKKSVHCDKINSEVLECIINSGINLYMSFYSDIRASVVLDDARVEEAMLAIHNNFISQRGEI